MFMFFFILLTRPPPASTLHYTSVPSTTLFRFAGIDPYQTGPRRCRGIGVCIWRLLTVVSVTGIRPAHRPVRVLHEEIVPRHPQGHQAPAVRRPKIGRAHV